MAPTSTYTVSAPIKIKGRWQSVGARVVLTDDEAEMYAAGLESKDQEPSGPYLPGQEPQPPTPVSPLLVAQADAGDLAAESELDRREGALYGQTALEGRGDVEYGGRIQARYQDRMMRPNEATREDASPKAYLPGQEPQAPTPVDEPTPADTPAPVQAEDEAAAPQEPTPTSAIADGTSAEEGTPSTATVTHTGGGWYEVRRPDGTTEKVQGKEAAEKAAGLA